MAQLKMFTLMIAASVFHMAKTSFDCGRVILVYDKYFCRLKDLYCLQCPTDTYLDSACTTDHGYSVCRPCREGKHNCYDHHMNATCESTPPCNQLSDMTASESLNKRGTNMATNTPVTTGHTNHGNRATLLVGSSMIVLVSVIWFLCAFMW